MGNVEAVRAILPEGVLVDAVVKADAYGHGAVGVASWLETQGAVDGLCVATVDEGLELRRAGLRLPILVLYVVPAERAVEAAAAGLTLTVGEPRLLDETVAALAAAGVLDPERPVDVHVEIETGLGRAGVEPPNAAAIAERIAAVPGLRLGGVWSHLAAPGDRDRSGAQRDRFEQAVDAVSPGLGGRTHLGHLAATGGLLASSVPSYDRVRLGLGLYGLVPDGLQPAGKGTAAAAGLRPVMSLHARPIRVADLPAGAGVSYGPTFETSRPSRIATLPIGYGDGWPRSLSNRAEAIVRGLRVPLVGNVAMDAVMADVTDVPGLQVDLDDAFTLLGEGGGSDSRVTPPITAGELAQVRTTVTWEVVTAMARRLPRVYHAAAVPVGMRTLTEEVYPWLPVSSSGTATSATSRSTRS